MESERELLGNELQSDTLNGVKFEKFRWKNEI